MDIKEKWRRSNRKINLISRRNVEEIKGKLHFYHGEIVRN